MKMYIAAPFLIAHKIIIWIKINVKCCVIAGTSCVNAHKTYGCKFYCLFFDKILRLAMSIDF